MYPSIVWKHILISVGESLLEEGSASCELLINVCYVFRDLFEMFAINFHCKSIKCVFFISGSISGNTMLIIIKKRRKLYVTLINL